MSDEPRSVLVWAAICALAAVAFAALMIYRCNLDAHGLYA